jgi:hypothetical protein
MATTTTAQTGPASRDEKVYHPLDRVRGVIRRYIVIEGVLSVALFFLAWFTLALALDYGVFKAFTWDWVQDGAWGLRAGALVVALGVLGGIFVFRIVRRLTIEFSYPALALVLERRFPKVLGDRLITAVELADVDDAAKYGYSKAMIRQTIDEARERVETVDVNEVFNWRRLRVMSLLAVGGVVGLVLLGFASHAIAAGELKPVHAAWKSYHVASIVVERDLLLRDTPWPRRALLELQGVDEKGIRTPRDSGKASVRVKAYRWVVADRSKSDGWRPLMWSEVNESFVGMPVPNLAPSTGDSTAKLVKDDATADEVLENPALIGTLKNVLGSEQADQLDAVVKKLDDMAAHPSNGRRFRKLESPGEVTYKYTGVKGGGEGALKPEGGSEFGGDITGLKEDALFRVRALDFRTPQRPITLVPPPGLILLKKTEYQPAYRHYASPLVTNPADPDAPASPGGYSLLAGLRQQMPEEQLTLTGQQSHFSVPIGTELVITGVTDKPIVTAFAIPQGKSHIPGGKFTVNKDGQKLYTNDPVPLKVGRYEEIDGDAKIERGTFTYEFKGEDRITSRESVQFEIEFVNEDGLATRRQIQINVLDDNPPLAEILPDVIRRVGKHHWVTAKAKIPFNTESRVKDEIGLSKVAYIASFEPSDADAVRSVRAAMLARKVVAPASNIELGNVAAAMLDYANQVRSDSTNARREASFGMLAYQSRDAALAREKFETVKANLAVPKPPKPESRADQKITSVLEFPLKHELRMGVRDAGGVFQRYRWAVEGDFFDLGVIEVETGKKMAAAEGDPQTRYEMRLFVEATDTNFDTGPRSSRSEPIELLVVSDSDLLVEIGKDEQKLGVKLDDALKKLALARSKYEFVRLKSENHLPDELDAVRVRSKDAMQDVAKAREFVDSVARDFRRIEQECVYNQLTPKNIAQYGVFANRGDRIMGENPRLVSQEEEESANDTGVNPPPFGRLTPKSTFPRTEKDLNTAHDAFDNNQWPSPSDVTSAQIELTKLEAEVQEYRRAIGESQDKERLKNLIKSISERQDAIARAILKAKVDYETGLIAETPKIIPVGQLLLSKGETKKIRQGIQWRQFRGDEITVKLASSDAAVIVPAEIKLDFERNSLDFEYEIRAGAKDGEYKITLTPSSGDPVVVQVQVK